jgi:hypothetical protein
MKNTVIEWNTKTERLVRILYNLFRIRHTHGLMATHIMLAISFSVIGNPIEIEHINHSPTEQRTGSS